MNVKGEDQMRIRRDERRADLMRIVYKTGKEDNEHVQLTLLYSV